MAKDANNPTREIWRIGKVTEKTGLSRSMIYLLIQRGEFPKPRKIVGARASGWDSLEVQPWIDARFGGAA